MATTLSESFKEKYQGASTVENLNSRHKLALLIERNLPVNDQIVESGDCQKVRFSNNDLFTMYKAIRKMKNKPVRFVYNGRSVEKVEKYKEISEESSKTLKEVWRELLDE